MSIENCHDCITLDFSKKGWIKKCLELESDLLKAKSEAEKYREALNDIAMNMHKQCNWEGCGCCCREIAEETLKLTGSA